MKFKINMMNRTDVLTNLQERNNALKSKLLHEQIRFDNYSFGYFHKYSSIILNEYREHKSLCIASQNVGVNHEDVINWYVQGQLGNPIFNEFSTSIDMINDYVVQNEDFDGENNDFQDDLKDDSCEGSFEISQYGDGWSYKTFRDGEKIFIISNDLETLKNKVRTKHLPLD
ncbi:MAG: hypothetical protein J6M08_09460 [Methanobrevibacter sp.]|nr:hypothetical protein [Methanobrevibacter sp.]